MKSLAAAAVIALIAALALLLMRSSAPAVPPPPPPPPRLSLPALRLLATGGPRGAFGVEVLDLNLSTTRTPWPLPSWWKATLRRHGLLLLRGQQLTPSAQIAFTRLFGAPERMPVALDESATSEHQRQLRETEAALDAQGFDRRHVLRVSNDAERGYTSVGVWWHSDGSMRDRLSAASIWHLVKAPLVGGETRFARPCAIFAAANTTQRAAWRALRTMHASGLVSNLVHVDPRNASRACLRVNLAGTTMGLMARRRSDALGADDAVLRARDIVPQREAWGVLHDIRERFDAAAYAHPYAEGDVIVVDGYAVAHHASPSDAATDGLRVLHRTTVEGTHPTLQWRTEFRAARKREDAAKEFSIQYAAD